VFRKDRTNSAVKPTGKN
jgi:hypothetical protein